MCIEGVSSFITCYPKVVDILYPSKMNQVLSIEYYLYVDVV